MIDFFPALVLHKNLAQKKKKKKLVRKTLNKAVSDFELSRTMPATRALSPSTPPRMTSRGRTYRTGHQHPRDRNSATPPPLSFASDRSTCVFVFSYSRWHLWSKSNNARLKPLSSFCYFVCVGFV
jgi:hypothetical protein